MTDKSIFADDWRDSLRAHYIHTVQTNDLVTLKTLEGVLLDVGFSRDELRDLYVQATMRVEDVPEGFAPDMERAALHDDEPTIFPAVDVIQPETVDADVIQPEQVEPEAVNELQPESVEEAPDEQADDFPPDDDDPDQPKQLSLF